jgi:hypothetical protein
LRLKLSFLRYHFFNVLAASKTGEQGVIQYVGRLTLAWSVRCYRLIN